MTTFNFRRASIFTLFGSLLVPAACNLQAEADGSGSVQFPPSTFTEVEARDVCGEVITPFCASFAMCNPTNFSAFYVDEADCVARQSAACVAEMVLPGISVSKEELIACGQDAASCEFFEAGGGSIYDSCGLRGALEQGLGCVSSSQCQTGYCTDPELGCGKCLPLKQEGDECSDGRLDMLCADGLSCSDTSDTCLPEVAPGEACGADAACDDWGACVAGSCEPRGGEGEPCANYNCRGDRGCFQGTCRSFALVEAGATCDVESDTPSLCNNGDCTFPDDTCVSYPAIGEPCGDDVGCGVHARCDESTNTCQLIAPTHNTDLCYGDES
jgi:hypothetical protein